MTDTPRTIDKPAIHLIWALTALLIVAFILAAAVRSCETVTTRDKAAIEHGYIRGPNSQWIMPSNPNR